MKNRLCGKWAGRLAMVLGACLLLAACVPAGASGDGEAESIVWGIVHTASEDEWQDALQRSLESAASAAGIKVISVNADHSRSAQIAAIRTLIAFRPDVISFSPFVATGWENVMAEAQSAGIPILVVNKNISARDTAVPIHYVGYDYLEAGARLAQTMLQSLDGTHIVAELSGTTGASQVLDLTRGIRTKLRGSEEWTMELSVDTDFMQSHARELTRSLLSSSWEVDVVICHSDAITLGALAAIEEMGKVPGRDVLVFAVGGAAEVARLAQEGKVAWLVQCDPAAIGPQAVACILQLLADPPQAPLTHYLPFELLTAGGAEEQAYA